MTINTIQVPSRARHQWELTTEPLYQYECLGCGTNVCHNHRLDDCLKTHRRKIEALETAVADLLERTSTA
jgi:predicted nucleic acid-binding Zn ribbon protein